MRWHGSALGNVLRVAAGFLSIFVQVCCVIYARFVPARYFCWAPNDTTVEYSLRVMINGKRLDDDTVRERYQRPWFEEFGDLADPYPGACGRTRCRGLSRQHGDNVLDLVEFRSYQHAIDVVRLYERTYGLNDHASVTMRYRVNGGKLTTWTLPQAK